jgi:hypothetical protein
MGLEESKLVDVHAECRELMWIPAFETLALYLITQ